MYIYEFYPKKIAAQIDYLQRVKSSIGKVNLQYNERHYGVGGNMAYTLKGSHVGITFAGPQGSPLSLQLFLDGREFTQKLMLTCFSKGKLYEPEVSRLFLAFLTEGDVVIDVGAHVGYFSLLAATLVGNSGRVIASEMCRDNIMRLFYHCQLNSLPNIQIVEGAIGNCQQEVSFYVNQDNDGGHALWDVGKHPYNQKSASNPVQKRVTMRTLDSITRELNIDRIKLIKMDVEGAEPLVLEGGKTTIVNCKPPFVICEINKFALQQMGYDPMIVRHFFSDLGYDSYLITDRLLPLPAGENYGQGLYNLLFARGDIAKDLL